MKTDVICDKCEKKFSVSVKDFKTVHYNDLIVEFFSCPECGKKYHVLTTDRYMRLLIDRRNKIQADITLNLRFKKQLKKIIKEQKRIYPKLKAKGLEILKGDENI